MVWHCDHVPSVRMRLVVGVVWYTLWHVVKTQGGGDDHVSHAIDEVRWNRYRCDGSERRKAQSCARVDETFSTWLARHMTDEAYEELACYVDKSAVKHYAKLTVPEIKVPTTLAVFDESNLHELSSFEFPPTFALKAVHGSGMGILLTNHTVYKENMGSLHPNQTMPREMLHETIRSYLNTSFNVDKERQYRKIHKAVVLEEFLGVGIPINLKVFLFQAKAIALDIYHYVPIAGPSGKVRQRISRIQRTDDKPLTVHFARPRVFRILRTMISAKALKDVFSFAARIAAGFLFARVDFYVVENAVYFSEITLSPQAAKYTLDNFFKNDIMYLLGLC